MAQAFHAIYEKGVLRPITPLNLRESVEVIGTLEETKSDPKDTRPSDPLLGLLANEADLLDAVLEDAMTARERHPFRAHHD